MVGTHTSTVGTTGHPIRHLTVAGSPGFLIESPKTPSQSRFLRMTSGRSASQRRGGQVQLRIFCSPDSPKPRAPPHYNIESVRRFSARGAGGEGIPSFSPDTITVKLRVVTGAVSLTAATNRERQGASRRFVPTAFHVNFPFSLTSRKRTFLVLRQRGPDRKTLHPRGRCF